MSFDVSKITGREPLLDYPWRPEVDRLLNWLRDKDSHVQAFCFDLVMSAAYSIENCINEWLSATEAYSKKDRTNKMYYLANASGSPPKIAKTRDGWPKKESISDSKTSAGMDRTDDIKKGIYQSLKIGSHVKGSPDIKTAIISNLPAYRHGEEYVNPFVEMLWGLDEDLSGENGKRFIPEEKLRRAFDFIITLEEPVLRGTEL